MNFTTLLLALCFQALAVPDSSSRWQRDENDCDDESSFLQSQLVLGGPHIRPTAPGANLPKASSDDESSFLQSKLVLGGTHISPTAPGANEFVETANRTGAAAPVAATPRHSLRGAKRASLETSEPVYKQLVDNMREEQNVHQEEVKMLTNAVAAVSDGTKVMAHALVEEGKAFEYIVIAVLCAFVLMPVGFALSALMFINFLPSLVPTATAGKAKSIAKSIALPGGLRGLRESLKPKVAQKKGGVEPGSSALAAAPSQTIDSAANDVEQQLDRATPVVNDHFARARQSLLTHPLSAESDIMVGPTDVCFPAEILPYRQQDVDLEVREVDADGSGALGIRIVVKEVGDDCGIMIESEGVPICCLYTGRAVVDPGQMPPRSRGVDLLRTGSTSPIATLAREDAFDGKLPGRVVARGGDGLCDASECPVLFEVLLDSHDRPMSVLLVDGRLIAKVSVTAKGLAVKTERSDDLWLAVAGVIASLKLANPPLMAG